MNLQKTHVFVLFQHFWHDGDTITLGRKEWTFENL